MTSPVTSPSASPVPSESMPSESPLVSPAALPDVRALSPPTGTITPHPTPSIKEQRSRVERAAIQQLQDSILTLSLKVEQLTEALEEKNRQIQFLTTEVQGIQELFKATVRQGSEQKGSPVMSS